jgi:hypothetical protein
MGSRKIQTSKERIDALRHEYDEAKAAGEMGRAVRLLTQINQLEEERAPSEPPPEQE